MTVCPLLIENSLCCNYSGGGNWGVICESLGTVVERALDFFVYREIGRQARDFSGDLINSGKRRTSKQYIFLSLSFFFKRKYINRSRDVGDKIYAFQLHLGVFFSLPFLPACLMPKKKYDKTRGGPPWPWGFSIIVNFGRYILPYVYGLVFLLTRSNPLCVLRMPRPYS